MDCVVFLYPCIRSFVFPKVSWGKGYSFPSLFPEFAIEYLLIKLADSMKM